MSLHLHLWVTPIIVSINLDYLLICCGIIRFLEWLSHWVLLGMSLPKPIHKETLEVAETLGYVWASPSARKVFELGQKLWGGDIDGVCPAPFDCCGRHFWQGAWESLRKTMGLLQITCRSSSFAILSVRANLRSSSSLIAIATTNHSVLWPATPPIPKYCILQYLMCAMVVCNLISLI